jgi:serine/threonine-protein kinase
MAYVDGSTLSRQMREGMTLREASDIMVGIGEGLKYAHEQGIIHRDVKFANVLLTGGGVPRITDFGLALIGERSRLTNPGAVMGTVNYMAPEQLMAEDADRRTDVWALGVLLYENAGRKSSFRSRQCPGHHKGHPARAGRAAFLRAAGSAP